MKRFFAALFVVMPLFSGCNNVGDGSIDRPVTEGREIVLNAEIGNDMSRTSHSWSDNGLATMWSEGDRITVFNDKTTDDNHSATFSLAEGAGTCSGKFQGTLPADDAGVYYAVYPFVEGSRYDRVSFDMTVGQIHSGRMDDMSHLSSHGIMYGSFTEDGNGTVTKPLSFRHLTAALKFNIILPEPGKITMVQFRAKNSSKEPFIIKGTFDASSGEIDKNAALYSNSVCVYMNGTEAFSEASPIMMFIPVDIAGLEMEAVVTADGKAYTKEITIPVGKVLQAGICYNLKIDCSAVAPFPAITVYAPGTLSTKLSGMTDITELKVNTAPGIELSAADFNAISASLKLRSLDLSGISNKVLPGKSSISYFTNITSVRLPAALETIGQYAFCQSAVNGVFVIPASVTSIDDYAFQNCANLTELFFAERTEPLTIGKYVFAGCANLTGALSLPAQLVNIGDYMFSNCAKITSLNFPSFRKPIVIGEYAFQGCKGLNTLIIPSMVVELGLSAFFSCTAATTIVFEKRTEPLKLGKNVFRNNTGLSGKLAIPETLTEIGNYAFTGCSYSSDSDKTIGIYFSSPNPPAVSGANSMFSQRVFVASEELKAVYEANSSWKEIIPYLKDGKLNVGTIE